MCSNNSPLISVIVPVYNAEKYISECINSIINQSVDYWTLILVNDGSTDKSGEICECFARKDVRIRVIHQLNGGPGKARNAGIDACNTDWFTFVDADDKISETYIENFFVSCCKEKTLSCQGFVRVDLDGKELGERISLSDAIYKGEHFLEKAFKNSNLYNFGQSVGKLYNKLICDEHNLRLSTDIKWCEDHLFYLQYLLYVNEIHTHSGNFYYYQYDRGQQTLTHRLLPYHEALNIFHSLYPAAENLISKYELKDFYVLKSIYYHSITAGFSLVIQNLYREEEDKKKRMQILNVLYSDMKRLHKKYYAKSLKGKLLKVLILYVPLILLDVILKYYNK